MAKLSDADITHVASLAKLDLTPEEIEKFKDQLSEIVEYVSQLEKVDTENVEPTSQTTGLTNMLREDEIDQEQGLTQDEAIAGTDKHYNGYFMVPAILNRDENS